MNNYDAAKILGLSGQITPKTVKQAYRKACSKYDPDKNAGGLEMMKSVNLAYETLKDFEGELNHKCESFGSDLMNVINSLSAIPSINLELCGTWLWISGETKAYKEALKDLSCRWAPKKKLWYYRPADHKSFGRGKHSMDEIREKHGSQSVKSKGFNRVKAA